MKIFIAIWLLASCASSPPQEVIRADVRAGQFDKANTFLEASDLKKKDRHRFLYLLEKGQLHYRQSNLKEALIPWGEAREMLKAFYKKSSKDKILNSIANNNYQVFYGEIWEQHQLFFHLSLTYLRLGQRLEVEQRDRVRYLASAKAVLLDWDSFIKSIDRNGVKEFYKKSFLARFYASHLHEMVGSSVDLQIAYQLMKDALEIKNGLVKAKETEVSILGLNVDKFIGRSLIRLAKKRGRKKDIGKWEKQFGLDSREVSLTPALILIETGLIAAKRSKRTPFGLNQAFRHPSSSISGNILSFGLSSIDLFSRNVLNLGYVRRDYYDQSYVRFNHNISGGAIEFEMPIREASNPLEFKEVGKIEFNSEDSDTLSINPELLLSFSALSRAAVNADFDKIYLKTGLRVAGKYILAIIASYQLYKSMLNHKQEKTKGKKGVQAQGFSGQGIARFSASTSFALSAASIRASERADIRYWSTLPDRLFIQEVNLKNGQYSINRNGVEIAKIMRKSQAFEIFAISLNNLN